MEKKKKHFILTAIVFLVIAMVGVYFGFRGYFSKKDFSPTPDQQAVYDEKKYAKYDREDGSFWLIPRGEAKITVSSNPKEYPRFVSGVIDPLDVSPGQIQTTRVVVESDVKPTRVWAVIEHDNGTDTIELELVSASEASFGELQKAPYFVNDEGILVLREKTPSAVFTKAFESLIARAKAQGVLRYEYEGKWLVHSTHTKKYRTFVYAEDDLGRKGKIELAWSDPCQIDSEGYLQYYCGLSEIWGADGLDLDLDKQNITLIGGVAKLVFNPEKTIKITGGGSINSVETPITGGAEIKEGYVCYVDADGDTWTPNVSIGAMSYSSSDNCPSGKIRVASSPSRPWIYNDRVGRVDCYDSGGQDANLVNPGQINYFYTTSTYSGEGGWDYNCSGQIEGGWGATTEPYREVYERIAGYEDDEGRNCANLVRFSTSTVNYCGEKALSINNGCLPRPETRNIFRDFISLLFPRRVFARPTIQWGWYSKDCQQCIAPTMYGKCH